MPLPRTIDRIVEDQARSLRSPRVHDSRLVYRPVIALSQLPGARGHELARRLCDDLRYALFDREIIHEIATRAHVNERVVGALDEHQRSALTESLAALLAAPPLSGHDYFEHLVHVVRSIGRRGAGVIVGRGAHLILGPGEALRVLVEAPRDARIATLAERRRVAWAEACRGLAEAEAERRAFLRQYFQSDADDLGAFDLAVNTHRLGLHGAASAIEAALFGLAGPTR